MFHYISRAMRVFLINATSLCAMLLVTLSPSQAAPMTTALKKVLLTSADFPLAGTWTHRYLTGAQIEAAGKNGPLKMDQHFNFVPENCNPFDLWTLLFLQQYSESSEESLFENQADHRKMSVTLAPDNMNADEHFTQFINKVSACDHFTITQNYPNNAGKFLLQGTYTKIPSPTIARHPHARILAYRITATETVTLSHPRRGYPARTVRRYIASTYLALVRDVWVTVLENKPQGSAEDNYFGLTQTFQAQIRKVLTAR